jgi:hypothetical protein
MLHGLGLDVPAGATIDVARALDLVDIGRRQDFYYTLRSLLVHRVEDIPLFDDAFRTFWRAPRGERVTMDLSALGEQRRFGKPEVEVASLTGDDGSDAAAPSAETVQLRTYSARETLREKDFGKLTPEELEQARAMMRELIWQPGLRRSRRWESASRGPADLRRLLRAAARGRSGLFPVPSRERRSKRRPLVVLCDVSGSMERYSRMLLEFVHCLSAGFERVEAFFFATRLTRVTLELRRRSMGRAMTGVARTVPDWSGGTRIGEALRVFHVHWARRVLGHGPVVLLISDGWDRGDPDLLAREMARLRRSCHRLIWLNPLLGSPAYEPLTRGIRAALPYVDDFLPVHNLASLEGLARRLNTLSETRRRRMLA